MSNPKIDGVLRCMTCGTEAPRTAAGLNYGFPRCCGQNMVVITPQQLQEEKEFYDAMELEDHFMRSAG